MDVVLTVAQWSASGDTQLFLDDVHPVISSVIGCSTWMRGIHLDKVELAIPIENSKVPAPR